MGATPARSLGVTGRTGASARLTGAWRDVVGRTPALSAAHDGPELALVRFDTEKVEVDFGSLGIR